MTVRIVTVTDLSEFAYKIGVFRDGWGETRKALHLAIIHKGQGPISLRVPSSSRKRYPKRIDAGNANLRKSIRIYVGQNSGYNMEVLVASEGVPYARFVHNMPDPLPSGKPVNWTKVNTGNKFLYKPLHDNRKEIPKDFCAEIDARMRRMGL